MAAWELDPLLLEHVRALKDPFVVQVGASDGELFDPIHPAIVERNLAGLLLEPMPDLLHRCQQSYTRAGCSRLQFVAMAVARGPKLRMQRLRPAILPELPAWAVGLSTARRHNWLTPRIAKKSGVDPEVIELMRDNTQSVDVPAGRLSDILAEYKVKKVDVLIIDVEGMELDVLQTMQLRFWRPAVIFVGWITMSVPDRHKAMRMLRKHGYGVFKRQRDWLALYKGKLGG